MHAKFRIFNLLRQRCVMDSSSCRRIVIFEALLILQTGQPAVKEKSIKRNGPVVQVRIVPGRQRPGMIQRLTPATEKRVFPPTAYASAVTASIDAVDANLRIIRYAHDSFFRRLPCQKQITIAQNVAQHGVRPIWPNALIHATSRRLGPQGGIFPIKDTDGHFFPTEYLLRWLRCSSRTS